MTEEIREEKPAPIITMLRSDVVGIFLLGAAAGFLVWALGIVLDRYVFDVYFCQGDVSSQCRSAKNYAAAMAGAVAAIGALLGLIRLRVYRPLLVVIAAVISTWGVVQLSWGLDWFIGLPVVCVFYALAYGVFSWLARIREFWITLLAMTLLVVAVRLALAS